MKKIDELMQERKSARDFETNFQIPEADLEMIVNSIRLAPTCNNILNYRVLVLSQSEFRTQLNAMVYNQKNFINSSVYLLFVAQQGSTIKKQTIYEAADLIFPLPTQVEIKNKYVNNFQKEFELRFGNQSILANEWSAKQAYIGAGVGTVAAASVGIDTCIQEGMDFVQLTQFLQKENLVAEDENVVLGMALGQGTLMSKTKIRKEFLEFAKIVK